MDTAESKPSINETPTDAIAVDMTTKHGKQEKRSEKGEKLKECIFDSFVLCICHHVVIVLSCSLYKELIS